MIHALYKTTNLINNKYYIGVHTTDDVGFGTDTRIDGYIGSGKSIQSALKKYGRKNFSVEIIAYYDNEQNAYDAEKYLITPEWLLENKKQIYNMSLGGSKPPTGINSKTFTKGRVSSTKGLKRITNGQSVKFINENDIIPEGWEYGGLKHNLDSKKLMSSTRKEFLSTGKIKKSIPPSRKGTTHITTPEHKAKISLANKGRPCSEEHKLKISLANKGKVAWNKGLKKSKC